MTAGRIHGNQLIHHSDRGSQYVSLKYSTALAKSDIRPSVATVGDSYDNALAETVNGLYKAELIHAQGPWTSVGEVELATLRWVHWWNTKRLHEALNYAPTRNRNRALSHLAHQHRAVKEAELNPGRFRTPKRRSSTQRRKKNLNDAATQTADQPHTTPTSTTNGTPA